MKCEDRIGRVCLLTLDVVEDVVLEVDDVVLVDGPHRLESELELLEDFLQGGKQSYVNIGIAQKPRVPLKIVAQIRTASRSKENSFSTGS